MTGELAAIIDQARRAASAGRWDEAEQFWRAVRRLAPDNTQALFALGVHAMRRGDCNRARPLLEAACTAQPGDVLAWLTLAKVRGMLGERDEQGAALQRALAIDPYHLPSLLEKAAWLERGGAAAAAAIVFRNALKIAPPRQHWPAELRGQLEHGLAYFQHYAADHLLHITRQLDSLWDTLPADRQGRWREAASIAAGLSRPYHSEANQLQVPRLPAIPFFDRDTFEWAPALEARTEAIQQEFIRAQSNGPAQFQPYIRFEPGAPVDQWVELNHSLSWRVLHLWRHGEPVAANAAACPQTANALAATDMAHVEGFCPNVMFSVLAAHTHIPPHQGETNARVVAHLPLIVPDGCRYRVGFEERQWRRGELLVFDDTIEHEARNDSDEARVVLIFDLWNPLLSAAEREITRALLAASKGFQAQ